MYVDKQTSFMRRIDRLVQLVALRFYNIPTKLRLLSGTVLALRAFMTSFRGAALQAALGGGACQTAHSGNLRLQEVEQ